MLRFFFYCFLIVNVVFLSMILGVFGQAEANKKTAQQRTELHPEQLQLITADAASALVESESASKRNEDKKAQEASAASQVIACLEVSPFQQSELAGFETKLKSLALGDRQSRRNVIDLASHIVFIPSLGSKDGADKKAAELKRLGINEFFIIQDQSNLRWGISLGVFRTEEAAKQHLANLNGKGVKTARIGQRTVTVNKFAFQLHNLTADEKKRFDAIMGDYHEQEVKACAPAASGASSASSVSSANNASPSGTGKTAKPR